MASRPDDDDDGVDLSPDAPTGVPAPPVAPPAEPVLIPMPGDGGVIAPGPTPESR